jgi:hypothetical protein
MNGRHQLLVHADDVNILDKKHKCHKEYTEKTKWLCLATKMQDKITIY